MYISCIDSMVVTKPESIQLIPFIQSIAQTNPRIRTHFQHENQPLLRDETANQVDKETLDQFFLQMEKKLDEEGVDKKAFNLDYLKTIYNSLYSELTTSMTIKDESVEMDLITFRWIHRTHHANVLYTKIQDGLCREVVHLILQGNSFKEEDRKNLKKTIKRDSFPNLSSLSFMDDNYSSLVKCFVVAIPLHSIKLVNCILDEKDLEGIVVASQNSLKSLWVESEY